MQIQRALGAVLFVLLFSLSSTCRAVAISGSVMSTNGAPLCALVLANGQFMFTCSPVGDYALDAPLDGNGQITLFGFADGYFPFKTVLDASGGRHDITLIPAPPPDSADLSQIALSSDGLGSNRASTSETRRGFDLSAIGARASASKASISIAGSVTNANGEPLCALVLANGQFMFSCSPVGTYNLSNVPLDASGQITLFGFADGYFPFKVVFGGSSSGPHNLTLKAPGAPAALESVTQNVSAALGATLTLPSGSSVTIPPGALPSDQPVTLSKVGQLATQPPSGIITGTGPALILKFASRVSANDIAGATGIKFVIKYNSDLPSDLSGSAPLLDIVDEDNFVGGVPINCDSSSACFVVPLSMIQNAQSISATSADLGPLIRLAPPAPLGPRIWNGSSWVDFPGTFDPNKRTLVLIHGVLSTVEGAFGPCVNDIMATGGYQQVVGFDYDWTQQISKGGQQLANFLGQLHSLGLQDVDVEAHSYGTVNALYAASLSDIHISNMILEGGPLKGSPLANLEFLVTVLANMGVPNNPYVSAKTIKDVQNSGMALDLQPGNVLLDVTRQNAVIRHPETKFIKVAGTNTMMPDAAVDEVFFTGEPNDGVIPTSSAYAPDLPGPTLSVPEKHTALECAPEVLAQVGKLVNGTPADNQKPNLTPFQPTGWSDKIVVTKSTGSTVDSSSIGSSDPLYVSFAILNNGTATTSMPFHSELDLDGVQVGSFNTSSGLDPNHYTQLNDYSIGKLAAGIHALRLVIDVDNAINESNEQDNEYTKTITVANDAPAQCTYSYSDWGACQPDNTQSRSVISSTPAGCIGTPQLTQPCSYSPPTITMNWQMADTCNDGLQVEYAFFDNTQNLQVSPNQGRAWVIQYGQTFTNSFSCSAGDQICYGAADSNGYWGVSLNDNVSDPSACNVCSSTTVKYELQCGNGGGGGGGGSGQCTGLNGGPHACQPCSSDSQCDQGDSCWTGPKPAPFCGG